MKNKGLVLILLIITLSITNISLNTKNHTIITTAKQYLESSYSTGDINKDGIINKEDASIIVKHIIGKEKITDEESLELADFNKDGIVKMNDVIALLKYYLKNKPKNILTATFIIQDNDATTISTVSSTCEVDPDETGCIVQAPTLEAKTGYTIIGWNKNANATTSSLNSGAMINISNDVTYYSITRASEAITATFTLQDSSAAAVSASTTSCYKYNGAESCNITAPTLTAKTGYTVIGWSTSASSTTSGLNSGASTTISNNTTYYSVTRNTTAITATFTLQDSSAASVSGTISTCYKYNGATSCKVTAPTLTAKTGYIVIGWSTSTNSTTSSLSSGATTTISSNTTYYSVTRNTTAITATFTSQDSNAATASGSSATCYKYNGATSCKVTAPTLTAKSGYTVIGWSTSTSATTSNLNSGASATISNNATYYSVTRNATALKATFTLQDANAATASGSSATCYKYNGEKNCYVTAPTLTAKSGYTVIGWNIDKTSTTYNVRSGKDVQLSSNIAYYSITKQTITVTFNKNTTFDNNTVSSDDSSYSYYKTNIAATSLTFTSTTCDSYNGQGCYIKNIPTIISSGNETRGFSTTSTGYETYNIGLIKFTQNTTLYARVYNYLCKDTFSINSSKTRQFGNTIVEVDSSLSSTVVDTYLAHLEQLSKDIPELFYMQGKLRLAGADAYDSCASSSSYTHTSSAGLTWGYGSFPFVLVYVSSSVSEYTKGTFVHELGHAFDSKVGSMTGTKPSVSAAFKDLYDSYKDLSPRPMRDYSYSSYGEFIADSFRWYYAEVFKTFNNNIGNSSYITKDGESISEIHNSVIKYRCIARNNYNEGANC